MGLDMYLSKKTYVQNWSHNKPEDQFEVVVKKGGVTYPHINPSKVKYVEEEVMYWRKFNALHSWFVENVQGGVDECQTSYLHSETLSELVDVLKQVKHSLENSPKGKRQVVCGYSDGKEMYDEIDVFEDTSVAEELLPTTSGFFFGGTEYDSYYLESVNETLEVLEKELEIPCDGYYYHASW
jgi:hypothetical protein